MKNEDNRSCATSRAAATTSTTVLISGIFLLFFPETAQNQGGRAVFTLKAINKVIIMRPSRCSGIKYHTQRDKIFSSVQNDFIFFRRVRVI